MCRLGCVLVGVPLVYARGRTYIDGLFSCVYGVPCMCWVFIMFVWCTVDVFSLRSPIAGSFSSLYGVLCACCHGLRCTAGLLLACCSFHH